MFKTLKEILRTGNATVKYPYAPIERPEHARGKPEHDSVKCIACSACAVACPPNAIQMVVDDKAGTIAWSINYGRCIFCGRCEEVCPTDAILLSPEFELAVMNKDDLEEICIYKLHRCQDCGKYFASEKEVDYATRLLIQCVDDWEAEEAALVTGFCPACKQKADAFRAKRLDETLPKRTPMSSGGKKS